ncbi:hypothetical protein ACYJ2V_001085 [Clostridium botulinum]
MKSAWKAVRWKKEKGYWKQGYALIREDGLIEELYGLQGKVEGEFKIKHNVKCTKIGSLIIKIMRDGVKADKKSIKNKV